MEYLTATYRYTRRTNLGNYEHREESAELTARLERKDCPEDALASLRALTANQIEPGLLEAPLSHNELDSRAETLAAIAETSEEDPFAAGASAHETLKAPDTAATTSEPKKRGRPKGSTNKAKAETSEDDPFAAATSSAPVDSDPFDDAPAPAPSRLSPATASAAAPGGTEIADKVLIGACAKYVQAHGAPGFHGVLAAFGVKSAVALGQDQRPAFLAALKGE